MKNSLRAAIEIALLGALIFGLLITMSACKGSEPVTPASTSPVTISNRTPAASSIPGTLITDQPDFLSTSYPPPQGASPSKSTSSIQVYPPPIDEGGLVIEVPEPSPTPTATPVPFPETPPVPSGKAATLHNGDVWLVEPGHQPQALTDFGDVSAIFGWNRDGALLLFGRGRNPLGPHLSDATELWLLDTTTSQVRQLTSSFLVWSAGWSPVSEQIAYCEYSDTLTIIALDGMVLNQLENAICDFAWSPSGSAIAVIYSTPDMIAPDSLKFTTLAIWWLEDERLQLFSDAVDEAHTRPVWFIDGQHVLFERLFTDPDKRTFTGLHIADVISGQTQYVNDTRMTSRGVIRSPRADLFAYKLSGDIYVMDAYGQFKVVGQGQLLAWLPDGRTLPYRAEDGNLEVIESGVEVEIIGTIVGGQRSPTVHIQPEYFFVPGG